MSNPSNISTAMIEAVCRGNPRIVRNLLTLYGLNYSPRWLEGYRLLLDAIRRGHKKVAKLLLRTGAKVNYKGEWGDFFELNTPLHCAVLKKDLELVCMLLELNADLEVKNSEGQTPLHRGVASENEKIVSLFLSRGAFIDPLDHWNLTPLHCACFQNHFQLVELLLKNGADVSGCRSEDEQQPLHTASENGMEEIVGLLLEYGANPNALCDGNTPLHYAAGGGFSKIAELLLENSANVNALNDSNDTPLYLAVKKQCLPLVKCILRYGPCISNEYNRKSLSYAVGNYFGEESQQLVECLTEYGFNLNPEDAGDSRLLYTTVYGGYTKLVEFLLSYEADPNITIDNFSLLNIAVSLGHERIVELLLDAGCLLNVPDYSGKKPVDCSVIYSKDNNAVSMLKLLISHGACITSDVAHKLFLKAVKRKNLEVCRVLAEYGADINGFDDCDRSALMYTALKDDDVHDEDLVINMSHHESDHESRHKIAEFLLNSGADVNAKTENNQTVLHIAALNGFDKVVSVLLEHEANIHAVDEENKTALYLAVAKGHECIAEILLKHGALVNASCNLFKTPLEVALDAGFLNVMAILLKYGASLNFIPDDESLLHTVARSGNGSEAIDIFTRNGADVNARTRHNVTPLHLATIKGHGEMVEALLKNGANVDAVNINGAAPLHIAAFDGNLEIVEDLLKFDADVNLKDAAGRTPLHLAAYKKHSVIVQILLENGADINVRCHLGMTPISLVKSSSNEALRGIANYFQREYLESVDDSDRDNEWRVETTLAFEYHTVKLKTAGYYVCPENLDPEHFQGEFSRSFATECEKEMMLMQQLKPYHRSVLTTILSANRKISYTKNNKTIQLFKNINLEWFPIYRMLIENNLKNDIQRYVMLKSGLCNESFYTLIRTSNALNRLKLALLPTEIVQEILSFLSRKDLERLVSCSQNLKKQFKRL